MARLGDCGTPLPYGLTAKKAKFAEPYLHTHDRLKSLKLAGYNSGTENSANVQACKLLKDQGVKNYMADLIAGEPDTVMQIGTAKYGLPDDQGKLCLMMNLK